MYKPCYVMQRFLFASFFQLLFGKIERRTSYERRYGISGHLDMFDEYRLFFGRKNKVEVSNKSKVFAKVSVGSRLRLN